MNREEITALLKAAFRDGLGTGYHEGINLGSCGRVKSTDELMEMEWEFSDTKCEYEL